MGLLFAFCITWKQFLLVAAWGPSEALSPSGRAQHQRPSRRQLQPGPERVSMEALEGAPASFLEAGNSREAW